MLYGMIGVPFVHNSAFRKFDFRGRWSVSPKNRGRSKKTQKWTGLKSGSGSLAVGTYLQRGSGPPPPRRAGPCPSPPPPVHFCTPPPHPHPTVFYKILDPLYQNECSEPQASQIIVPVDWPWFYAPVVTHRGLLLRPYPAYNTANTAPGATLHSLPYYITANTPISRFHHNT